MATIDQATGEELTHATAYGALALFSALPAPSSASARNTTSGGVYTVPRLDWLSCCWRVDVREFQSVVPVQLLPHSEKARSGSFIFGNFTGNYFAGRFGRRETRLDFAGKQFRLIPASGLSAQFQALCGPVAKLSRIDWAVQLPWSHALLGTYLGDAVARGFGVGGAAPTLSHSGTGSTLTLTKQDETLVVYQAFDQSIQEWVYRVELRWRPVRTVFSGLLASPSYTAVFGVEASEPGTQYESEPEDEKNFKRGLALLAKFSPPQYLVEVKDFLQNLGSEVAKKALQSAKLRETDLRRKNTLYLAAFDARTGEVIGPDKKYDLG